MASGGKAENNSFIIQYEEFNNIFDRNSKLVYIHLDQLFQL